MVKLHFLSLQAKFRNQPIGHSSNLYTLLNCYYTQPFKMFCNEDKGHFSTSKQILESVYVPGRIFKALGFKAC